MVYFIRISFYPKLTITINIVPYFRNFGPLQPVNCLGCGEFHVCTHRNCAGITKGPTTTGVLLISGTSTRINLLGGPEACPRNLVLPITH